MLTSSMTQLRPSTLSSCDYLCGARAANIQYGGEAPDYTGSQQMLRRLSLVGQLPRKVPCCDSPHNQGCGWDLRLLLVPYVGWKDDTIPVASEVLRLVDCTVTAHIPLHPLEEEDHDALQQYAAQHGQQGEPPAGVQGHSDCLEI